jgi:hypothetical protein
MFRCVRMREHWCGPDLCDQDVHHLLGKTHGQDQGGHVAIEGEQYLVAARGGRCPCYSGRRVVPVRRDCSGTVELSAAPEQLCCRVRDTGCSPHRSGQRRLDRLGGETVPPADVRRAAARRGLADRFVVGSWAGSARWVGPTGPSPHRSPTTCPTPDPGPATPTTRRSPSPTTTSRSWTDHHPR